MNAAPAQVRMWVLGEFDHPEQCVAAARSLREANAGELDAYSPYPLHGIDEALALPRSKVPLMALTAGLSGVVGGYLLQWWTNAHDYVINVANRPPHSAPLNVPVTFESGILLTAISLFFGTLFFFCRMPRTHHPVFEAEAFRSASLDKFWISIARDADVEEGAKLEARLRELGARKVTHVLEGA